MRREGSSAQTLRVAARMRHLPAPRHVLLALTLASAWGCDDDVTSTTTGAGGAGGTAQSNGAGGTAQTNGAGGTAQSNGAGATGGAGGTTPMMGATPACQDCVAMEYSTNATCMAAVQACDGDAACDAWKNCNEDCFNEDDREACYAACDTSFPHDTSLSQPLLDCTCDACATDCVASCA